MALDSAVLALKKLKMPFLRLCFPNDTLMVRKYQMGSLLLAT
ncbi:hypothetical protein CSC17_1927 [Klebsiella oxytoca]|nr:MULTISPECIES: hypothetical protein [Klebsiella]AWF38418.1 hypothetical protein CSC17_1927 [Klebsiella oxytoca]EUC88221.1 hypothetical protein HMPREF1570_4147 [Klebsiella oxytoca KA-2]MDM4272344.1 hypothetical protein [Klebsiella oxytoca]MDU7171609.1 hypothetical protein [Klebsiella oxytoca]